MSTKAFELESSIKIDSDKVLKGLKDVDKQVNETGKGMDKMEGKSGGLGKALGGLGKTIASTFALGKIKNFTDECIQGINKQIQVETKLQNNLMATGKATQSNVNDLKDYASHLQKVGVIGDEVGMAGMAQLATFNLTSASIKTLSDGMYNLAVNQKGVNATQEDMMGYANMIGKAMQGQATALTRVGVTMNEHQKKIIETGTEQEKASVIAEVLKNNYGNLNEEIANTPEGKAAQLANDFGDLKELMGNLLLPIVSELVGWLQNLVNWFNNLSPGMQNAVMIGGLIVALLPSVIGLISGLVTIFTALTPVTAGATVATGGFGLAIGGATIPIWAIILAIGALIGIGVLLWQNWDTLSEKSSEAWSKITSSFSEFDAFLTGIFTTDWTQSFGSFGNVMNAFMQNINNIWSSIKRIFRGIIDFVAGVFTGDWSRAWQGIVNIFGGIMDGLGAVIKAPLNTVIGLINMAIDGLNSISFTAPDWVPFVGGKHFGVNLPKINYLYTGGVFDKPTLLGQNTVVGDKYQGQGSQREWVLPDKLLRETVSQEVRKAIESLKIEMDGRQVGKVLARYQDEFKKYNRGRKPEEAY